LGALITNLTDTMLIGAFLAIRLGTAFGSGLAGGTGCKL
jgi:hypothetical protein